MKNDKSCFLDHGWPDQIGSDTPQQVPPSREDKADFVVAIDDAIDKWEVDKSGPRPPETCRHCGMPWEPSCSPLTPHGEAIAAGDGTLHGAIDHWQERATQLQGEANVLADILRDAYEVIKTIESESAEEEESLWKLRYIIEMALAPYRPIEKTTTRR